ncbi:MAG: TonB-dependent receptor [Herminiimonas sp.]|uniref:TonB-dependent receptor n=1 Tax=Herminiimonas sp. TaxID=1926289 RepID=UPI00271E4B6C|nr:TonB-dependent receptor [Herminiimonas sp.]MDO9420444.1 TonB-dependent receptor [Herminiimonas sp.]
MPHQFKHDAGMHRHPAMTITPIAHAARLALCSALLVSTAFVPAMAQNTPDAAVRSEAARQYNIPAGSLDQVLGRFGREAGALVAIDPELTAGEQSSGLKGSYSVSGGLDAILGTHRLEAVPGTNGGYRLRRVAPGVSTLPAVTVSGVATTDLPAVYAGGQIARGGSLGLLGTQNVMDTPFSTVNYTAELLEDQQARTLADVVVNDASVRMTTGGGGFDDTFQIRGYAVGAGDVGLNGLYGLISSSRVPAQIVERAELLKGPGALVNGMPPGGSVGGSINTVTKRANDTPLTRLTTTYQSESNFTLHLDTGRRFGEDNAWGIRFNGLARDGEGSVNGNDQKSTLGAVALDYRGSKLRWSLDVIDQRDDTDNYRPQISLSSVTGVIPAPPDARTNFFPGTSLQQTDSTIATRVDYDFNDSLSGFAAIGYRDGHNEQIFPTTTAVLANGNFDATSSFYDSYSKTRSAAAGLRWRFDTASVKHNISIGVNQLWQETGNASLGQPGTVASNIYRPVPILPVTVFRRAPGRASDTTLSSFAISDTMSFANDRVLLTVGARDQTVDAKSWTPATSVPGTPYKASSITPIGAVVFKPVENVSLYANYTAGLSRGAVVGTGFNNTGSVLAPFKSKQYEGGVKVDWGRFTTTAAVYQITRPAIQNDTTTTPLPTRGYFGEQRNRGLELTTYGELQRGLRGMASIAFVEPKLTSTPNGANQGNDAAGVPDTTASASLDWDTPWVSGLALNTRVIYTSGSFLTTTNTQKFDSWTRYDIGARYRSSVGNKPVVFRANIENLFDKNYWLTTGTYVAVGSPRTLVLSASIDF